MLRAVATKEAEKQEAAAQNSALNKWKVYLQEGPASGLRRQHQFTKVATGWTETAVAEGVPNTIGEYDEMSGFSQAQVDALRAHH